MALVTCSECASEMSSDADKCPRCGKPNRRAINKTMAEKQKMGCFLIVISLPLMLIPPVGLVVLCIGLVLFFLNTRIW